MMPDDDCYRGGVLREGVSARSGILKKKKKKKKKKKNIIMEKESMDESPDENDERISGLKETEEKNPPEVEGETVNLVKEILGEDDHPGY